MTELDDFRAEKDALFGGHPQSPLTSEQRKNFQGLSYFPENEDLRLEVKVDEFEKRNAVKCKRPRAMCRSMKIWKVQVQCGWGGGGTDDLPKPAWILFAVRGFAWPEKRPTLPGVILNPSLCRAGASSWTSTWHTTHTVPTTRCGPARSPRRRTA
jgi:hypothetical protein